MSTANAPNYIEVTEEAGRAFVARRMEGSIVMLNLLRFRETADYSAFPELAPSAPITGEEAYQRYITHVMPYLEQAGSEVLFAGQGTTYLIGPSDARWDLVLLVRHRDTKTFLSFATSEGYLSGLGHRTAALEDSRLLPLVEELVGTSSF